MYSVIINGGEKKLWINFLPMRADDENFLLMSTVCMYMSCTYVHVKYVLIHVAINILLLLIHF